MTNRDELAVLSKLWIQGAIGKSYMPKEKALSRIPKDRWDEGKEALENLIQGGVLNNYKNGNTVSIRSDRVEDVRNRLEGHVPPYILDMHR